MPVIKYSETVAVNKLDKESFNELNTLFSFKNIQQTKQ